MDFIHSKDTGDMSIPAFPGITDHVRPMVNPSILILVMEIRINAAVRVSLAVPFQLRDHGKRLALARHGDKLVNPPELPGLDPYEVHQDPAEEGQIFRKFQGYKEVNFMFQMKLKQKACVLLIPFLPDSFPAAAGPAAGRAPEHLPFFLKIRNGIDFTIFKFPTFHFLCNPP